MNWTSIPWNDEPAEASSRQDRMAYERPNGKSISRDCAKSKGKAGKMANGYLAAHCRMWRVSLEAIRVTFAVFGEPFRVSTTMWSPFGAFTSSRFSTFSLLMKRTSGLMGCERALLPFYAIGTWKCSPRKKCTFPQMNSFYLIIGSLHRSVAKRRGNKRGEEGKRPTESECEAMNGSHASGTWKFLNDKNWHKEFSHWVSSIHCVDSAHRRHRCVPVCTVYAAWYVCHSTASCSFLFLIAFVPLANAQLDFLSWWHVLRLAPPLHRVMKHGISRFRKI